LFPFGPDAGDVVADQNSILAINLTYCTTRIQKLVIKPDGEVFAVGLGQYSLAPYFIQGGLTGQINYRITTKVADLDVLNDQILYKYLAFSTKWAIIITWKQIWDSKYNLFQLCMAIDETNTSLLFNYQQLDKKADEVYYMLGDGVEVAFNASVDESNCDVPGRFIFVVDGSCASEFHT
jgi:hypothetical protein